MRRHIGLLLTLVVFVLSGCGKTDKKGTATLSEAPKPLRGGTLTYAKNGAPITLDPALTQETESSVIVVNLFDCLVEQRAGRAGLDAGLARSWEISEDGLTYTFRLKRGVVFHDGTPFNADAVLFSIQRQRDPKHPYHGRGVNYEFWRSFNMDGILKDIQAPNDSTVVMTLFTPDATFLNVLSLNFMAIVSPTAVAKYGKDFYRNPVGSGAFKYVRWDPDGTVITAANEHYWNGRPYVDTLIFKPIPDARLRWTMLKNGEIDMMSTPDKADAPEIESSPTVKYSKQPGVTVSYLGMNMLKKPFDNLAVRRAIVYAINRDSLVEKVFGSLGRPAKNPIPPNILGYNEEIRFTPYDPDKSRQLLAEAGFPNGFKCSLWTLPIVREYMPNGKLAAELIQKDLRAVGIDVTIATFPWDEFLRRRGRGEHELTISGWTGDAPDPHFFFYPLLDRTSALTVSSTNAAFYTSVPMHDLITRGKTVADPVERSKVYKEACVLFNQDLPWFTIAHSVTMLPMRDYVMDFQLHSSAIRKFEKVWLNKNAGLANRN